MSKLRKTFKVVAVNLVILAVMVEAAANATYFFQTGSFFYGRSGNRKVANFVIPSAPINQGSEQQATTQQLHPYFV